MKWSALSEALDITTEMRPVHRAGKRGFLTKDAAIRDAIKGIARSLDYCDCAPREPDTMYGRGIDPEGTETQAGEIVAVRGKCRACQHYWKPRGITQVAQLPGWQP